jgi:hypothetical protein
MLSHKARERAAFRYIGALERGDFDTIAVLLRDAERDPALARMFAEIDQAYAAELDRPLTNLRVRKERKMTALSMPKPRALPERTAFSGLLLFAAMIALTFAVLLVLREISTMTTLQPPVSLSGDPMLEILSALPQNDTGALGSLCYQVTDSVPILRAGASGSDMLTPDMVFRIQSAQLVNEQTWLYVVVGETGTPQGWIDAGSTTFRIRLCDFPVPALVVELTPTVVQPTTSGDISIVLPTVVLPSVNVPMISPSTPIDVPTLSSSSDEASAPPIITAPANPTPTPSIAPFLVTPANPTPTPPISPFAGGG